MLTTFSTNPWYVCFKYWGGSLVVHVDACRMIPTITTNTFYVWFIVENLITAYKILVFNICIVLGISYGATFGASAVGTTCTHTDIPSQS